MELLEEEEERRISGSSIFRPKLNRLSEISMLPAIYYCVQPSAMTVEVLEYFDHTPSAPGILICKNRHMLGMITRRAFFEHISTGYGRAIFLSRSIIMLLDAISEKEDCCQPVYDSTTTIIEAAHRALSRAAKNTFEPIVACNEDGSHGIIDINVLLKAQGEILKSVNSEVDKMLGDACDYVTSRLPFPISEGPVEIDWAYIPHGSLGGDCFDYRWIDEDNFAFFVIDVSGHGIKPALLAVTVLNMLSLQKIEELDLLSPATVLIALNKKFRMKDHGKLFFTMWYGVWNKKTRNLTYSTAGHPPGILYNYSAAFSDHLETGGVVIGTGMDNLTYNEKTIEINHRADLYIFSDGIFEYTNKSRRKAEFEDWDKLLRESRLIGIKDSYNLVEQVKTVSADHELDDDCSLLHLTFH